MRVVLLAAAGLIAAAAASAPAAAQGGAAAAGFTGVSGVTVHRSGHFHRSGFPRAVDGRRDGRRHRGSDDGFLLYDREYQGDTAWRAESYNDWWHERPNRSHPAWMTRNQNCDRQWWSGDTLHC
jgi:hypothetical protein